MAKAEQAQDPSMEDILASIRRIISDDDEPANAEADTDSETGGAAAAEEADDEAGMSQDDLDKLFDTDDSEPEPEEEPADDVLELTEDFAVDDEEDDDLKIVDVVAPDGTGGDIGFEEVEAEEDDMASLDAEPEAVPGIEPVDYGNVRRLAAGENLSSSPTEAAVSEALGSLANLVIAREARTLEELIEDLVRPMLKAWLDTNLPPMVERLVQQEIERVSRGRRG